MKIMLEIDLQDRLLEKMEECKEKSHFNLTVDKMISSTVKQNEPLQSFDEEWINDFYSGWWINESKSILNKKWFQVLNTNLDRIILTTIMNFISGMYLTKYLYGTF
ncbi:hypothetical protein [Paenibacillus chitinolyticus]